MMRAWGFATVAAALALAGCTTPPAESPALPGRAVLLEVPFVPAPSGWVVIDLPANERSVRVLLDTGAAYSVLTADAARGLGVDPAGTPERMSTFWRPKPRFRAPTPLGRDLEFRVAGVVGAAIAHSGGAHGILGGDFLSDFVLEIDYPGAMVRFLDRREVRLPEPGATDAGGSVTRLRVADDRPYVDVELNGHRVSALIDTGLQGPAVFGDVTTRKARTLAMPTVTFPFFGVRGPYAWTLGEVQRLRIGDLAFANAPVLVAPLRGGRDVFGGNHAAIGGELLQTCFLRIDYARRRLLLRRDPARPVQLLGMDYGRARAHGALVSEAESGLVVHWVFPGSRAERMGLRTGDRILSGAGGAGGSVESVYGAIAGDGTLLLSREIEGRARAMRIPERPLGPAPP